MTFLKKQSPQFLFLISFFLSLNLAFAQENEQRCATADEIANRTFYPFQKQLNAEIAKRRTARKEGTNEVLVIPVVVHILYVEGDEVGEGTNISAAQVQSQIDVLNEDFRRLNPDRDETLTEFQGVAVDTEIEFVLAALDSNGNRMAERGITRHLVEEFHYTRTAIDRDLKPATIWDPTRYFNMWTVGNISGFLGYAQFPDMSGLDGLFEDEGDALTDGVVIDYDHFGDFRKVQVAQLADGPYNLGRTTTHEVAHSLGLLHPWGTFTGCDDEDDFCEDTPFVSSDTNGCNIDRQTCGNLAMVQNYMDYTWDSCMNLFTQNQMERMHTVLEVSPRRRELVSSPVLGLEQDTNELELRIFPNPTQGILHIRHRGFALQNIQIISPTGQEVWAGKLQKGQSEINLNHLVSGLYVLKAHTSQGVLVRKIVLE